MENRIKYLESLVPKNIDIYEKYYDNFSKYAQYMGNGVYSYRGILSTDTRELFLLTSLRQLGITYKEIQYNMNNKINNGDVFDIRQIINGVSQFLWFNNKWYYFVKGFTREYEYSQEDLTELVEDINGFEEVKYLGNILDNFKLKYDE